MHYLPTGDFRPADRAHAPATRPRLWRPPIAGDHPIAEQLKGNGWPSRTENRFALFLNPL
jgi:hypothetical protein